MSRESMESFLEGLERSHLLDEDWIDQLRLNRALETDPTTLAKELVEQGTLTHWQAEQLLAGRCAFFLGKYKLLEKLGGGGMGAVFKAQQARSGRIVALKVMAAHLVDRPESVARFLREVELGSGLRHPNIVAAYDADHVGKTYFLVMEYFAGRDLADWLKEYGRLPIGWSCECIRQAALGLEYAHQQGLVHRDIKPGNLLAYCPSLRDLPQVRILDFGLARLRLDGPTELADLTQTGQILGTPDYISPEQAQDTRSADIRADIFSLGCTLFRMLTGQFPFSGKSAMEKLLARASVDAIRLRSLRPVAPAELDAIVARMLARDPQDRYQTPAEVADALAPFAMSQSTAPDEGSGHDLAIAPPSDSWHRRGRPMELKAEADESVNLFLHGLATQADADTASGHSPTLFGPLDIAPLAPLGIEPSPPLAGTTILRLPPPDESSHSLTRLSPQVVPISTPDDFSNTDISQHALEASATIIRSEPRVTDTGDEPFDEVGAASRAAPAAKSGSARRTYSEPFAESGIDPPENLSPVASDVPAPPRKNRLIWMGLAAGTMVLALAAFFLPRQPIVLVDLPAERNDIRLDLDGRQQELPRTGPLEMSLEPGTHRIVILRRGFELIRVDVNLQTGDRKPIAPTWRPLLPAAVVAPSNSGTKGNPTVPSPVQAAPAPLKYLPGKAGRGLVCDGAAYPSIAHRPELDPQQFSVEAWIYLYALPDGRDQRRYVVSKNGGELTDGHFSLLIQGRRVGAEMNIGGGPDHRLVAAGDNDVLQVQVWQHVAMTYDGQDLCVYWNGALSGTQSVTGPRTTGRGPLWIGNRSDNLLQFNGIIDEVRLFDHALPAEDVSRRARQTDRSTDAPGLIDAWTFDPPR